MDKTAHVYKLAQSGSYFFLSRPRRFGKSLLLSTFKAYFLGKKGLFQGLAMEKLETEWKACPVLYLDINTGKYDEAGELDKVLNESLTRWEDEYGSAPSETTLALRFMGVIRRAYEKTGERVVILIDEYDKPMLQAIGDEILSEEYRNTLKAFYSTLKTQDAYIKFAFLTGVTKFGKVSVFSDLNNLNDISMDSRYIDICGLTDAEISDYFDGQIAALAQACGQTKEQAYKELHDRYDGYHFRQDSIGIYNPFSVILALSKQEFASYWFETGTPSSLVKLMQSQNFGLKRLETEPVDTDILNCVDPLQQTPIPILYQSGYLTIKSYDKVMKLYTLDFPNSEVKEGFLKYLLPFYTPTAKGQGVSFIGEFRTAVQEGRPKDFMDKLTDFFNSGDYRVQGKMELYFQNAMYLVFKLLGMYVDVETATSRGRIDVTVQSSGFVYVIELKLDGSAQDALDQIEQKGYGLKYSGDPRKLYKIGVNFSSETKSVQEYLIA